MQVVFGDLNDHEQAIVNLLAQKGRPLLKINTIGEQLGWFEALGKAKGSSRVRNSLRRLVRGNWLAHAEEIGDGSYRLTKHGLDRLRRVRKNAAAN
jgi:DNA-binding transcriptional regulator PaaX